MKNVLKVLLFSLVFSVGLSNISAQENKLDNLVNKMFTDVINKDFESILDMTHPKVFEIIPKEQMLQIIKGTFEGNGEFLIEISDKIPEYKVSNIYKGKENNLEYAFASYDMSMKMTFNNQEFDDERKKMMVDMMVLKEMDVKFISNSSMDILMRNRITILLKEDATENKWVMVNYDPDSPLFYKVLSTDLLEKAKQYKQDLLLKDKKKSDN